MLFAQNVMVVQDTSGTANSIVVVSVEIQNTDPFVAFQFDLQLTNQYNYVTNSASLTGRAIDHDIIANIIDDNILRVFAYSNTQEEISGNSGVICTIQLTLGTVPGIYDLILVGPIIGDNNSVNILTGQIDGSLTLYTSDINISPTVLDYDRVPLLQTEDRNFSIQNVGNVNLAITRIHTSFADFEVVGDTSLNILPGESHSVTIRFHSNTKGTYDENVYIACNDPDEPNQTVSLHVVAYAVNELNINDMFGRSGHNSTMQIDIVNMEPFVGFSFDLSLPNVMTFLPSSESLSDRAIDHIMSASIINNGVVRVVCYSPTNTAFTGSEGTVMSLEFMIDGPGGFYNLNFENPVIGDSTVTNIISDDYGGQLEIAAPNIEVNTDVIDFGSVTIFDTVLVELNISNNGSDTLSINEYTFYDSSFFSTQNCPIILSPGNNALMPILFSNPIDTSYQSTLRLRNNDPDEDPLDIQLLASVYIPNIMRVDSSVITAEDTGWINISIENYESFVGLQFDLILPVNLDYFGEVVLSERSADHNVIATENSPGVITIFAYSLSQSEFTGNSGAVVLVKVIAGSITGDFPVILEDVLIGNAESDNIMSSFEEGSVTVIPIIRTKNLFLESSWNLISWDVDTDNDSVGALLSSILDNVVIALGYEGGGLTYDPDWPEFSNLQLLDHLHGYWVKTLTGVQLSVTGATVPDSAPIMLEEGWNLVSYLPDNADSVAHALEGILDHTVVVLGFDGGGLTYDPEWPQFSNLKILSPGYGYWVKLTTTDTLIYPDHQVVQDQAIDRLITQTYTDNIVHPTTEWVSVFGEGIQFNGLPLKIGTMLQAKDPDGIICGEIVVTREGLFGMMPIYRDDPTSEIDEGAEPDELIRLYLDGIEVKETITWDDFGDVYQVDLTPQSGTILISYALSQNYPNPFNPRTQIRYQLPEEGYITLVVYNTLGQQVKTLVNDWVEEGNHSVYWNGMNDYGEEVSSGVYLCQMKAGTFTRTQKMILLR